MNRTLRLSPLSGWNLVRPVAALAIGLTIFGYADTAVAQKLRLINASEAKLVAYRPGPTTPDGKSEFVPDPDASLPPDASAWLSDAPSVSVFHAPSSDRGVVLRLASGTDENGKRTRTLQVHEFTGLPIRRPDDFESSAEQWQLAPDSASIATLTKDWNLVLQPVIPTKLLLAPGTVAGGIDITAKVLFNTAGENGTVVTLRSSAPEIATVPEQARADGMELDFVVKTSSVEQAQEVEISASAGGTREVAKFTVEPRAYQIVAVTFNRRNLIGGLPILGTVHVAGMTPDTEPVVVQLRSMSENAKVPDSVVVKYAPRLSRATFDIETLPVTHLQKGGVYASLAGEEQWGGFNLSPLTPVTFSAGRTTANPGELLDTLLRFRLKAPSPSRITVTATPSGVVHVPDTIVLETGETEIGIPVKVREDIDRELPVLVTVKAAMKENPLLAEEIRFEIIPR